MDGKRKRPACQTEHAAENSYLDTLAYDPADGCRSVRSTVHTKQAHCLGGALLGAHCLHRAGYGEPRIVCIDSVPGIDDGHAVALYQVDGLLGCVAKSNYTLIRSRDPMYRSLRELMMSYHDFYLPFLDVWPEKTD
eukprot:GEMP01075143.1.p3 GENE.GEMP01075143.1~~GEMP01075143.1.p3  ORF type:complete len:136 (+),score=27.35 GEMP01075143.1:158-565(+)